ncbi:hypothetical protein OG599_20905 [Streptomyces sp. NBC_01335]|uniref:hypothetical protein n=1 Tax=Streptomyces sp. NBC_01335 TaxID=2903828 RepID=UPI002E12E325|nr:hypothetical protein OG599_20905 [Streptomyces sp. NBC_01335]
MHGYGYPPELPPARPSPATLTVLRVVFVALAVLSCGFLAWAAMLRLAIVTKRPRDWALFALSLVFTAGLAVFFDMIPSDEDKMTTEQAFALLGGMLGLMGGVAWYYLHQDIRHFGPLGPGAVAARALAAAGYPTAGPAGPTGPTGPAGPVQGYGYPYAAPVHPAPPYGAPPVPHHPQGPAPYRPTPPQQQSPLQPQPTPPPQRPGPPQRLDQVRAELDELSDYLRKEGEGR